MFIYVIGPSEGAQKVGQARDAERRLRQLMTGNPQRLLLHFALPVSDAERNAVERRAHELLYVFRQEGEWFSVSPDDAQMIVIEAARQVRAGEPAPNLRPQTPDPHDLEEMRSYLGWLWHRRAPPISPEELGEALGFEPEEGGALVRRIEAREESVSPAIVQLCRMFLTTLPPGGVPGPGRRRTGRGLYVRRERATA